MGNYSTPPPTAPLGYPGIEIGAAPGSYEIPTSLFTKVFTTLRERYRQRKGGFTRVLKYGYRKGDKAPMAVVCLVDGPRDLRFEMLARIVGRQAIIAQKPEEGQVLVGGWEDWKKTLRPRLVRDVEVMFRYRAGAQREFESKARDHADAVVAEPIAMGSLKQRNPIYDDVSIDDFKRHQQPFVGYRPLAGEKLSGVTTSISGLGLARGALGKHPQPLSKTMKWLVKPTKPVSINDPSEI